VHENGRVEAHDVVVKLGHLLPPEPLDAVLELDAHGTVVPGAGLAAVDLGGLENKAAPLGEGDDLFHRYV